MSRGLAKCRPAGKCEGNFWTRFDKSQIGAIMRVARELDRRTRKDGKKNGAIGHIAVDVLEALIWRVDNPTGRLEPSIEWICGRVKRSRAAVVAALSRLREVGLVQWLRRYVPVEGGAKGPQIQQTTNAYRIRLPEALKHFLNSTTVVNRTDAATDAARIEAQKSVEKMEGYAELSAALDRRRAKGLSTFAI